MLRENPVNSNVSSDLNSTIILLVEPEMIFFSQLLKAACELGPESGPDNLDINFVFASIPMS